MFLLLERHYYLLLHLELIGSRKEIWIYIPNENLPLIKTILNRKELFGYLDYVNEAIDKKFVIITSVDDKYTPKLNTYSLGSGKTVQCKISKPLFRNQPVKENDVIYIRQMKRKFGCIKVGEETLKNGKTKPIFQEDKTTFVWWIEDYSIIRDLDGILEGSSE